MKNRIKKRILLLTAAGMVFSSSAFAFEAEYNPQEDSVSISGENNAEAVAVVIMPYEYTVDELTEDMVTSMPDVMFKSTAAGGKYEDVILLSDVMNEGKYRISENIGGNTKDSVFIRMKSDKTDAVIKILNKAGKSEFITAVEQFIESLSLDLPEAAVTETAEKLYVIKPSSGYTTESFYKAFMSAEGLLSFKYSKVSLADYFEEYAFCIDADLEEEYSSLTETQKSEAEKCASGIDFSKGDVSDTLSELLLIAKVHSADNWSKLKTNVEEYITQNNISVPTYASLTSDYSKNNVFIKLFDSRKSINNLESLVNKIETLAAAEKNSTTQSSSGVGGGASGGGGSNSSRLPLQGNPVTSAGNSVSAGNTGVFSDISTHWAKEDIEKMSSLGIVNGFEDNTFRPDEKVTRAEFVKMLVETLDIPGGGECSFEDVSDSDWFRQYVADAVNSGIVAGVSDTQFAPYNQITRQDAAVMVYRSIKESLSENEENISYGDKDDISDYALQATEMLTSAGLMNGSGGYFYPQNSITRAEAAVLLLRVYNII